jgi:hypothetical protein
MIGSYKHVQVTLIRKQDKPELLNRPGKKQNERNRMREGEG